MLDLIFIIKFVHLLAMAVMFGAWLANALFMVMAHRAANTSVIALTAVFVVRVELIVMVAAVVLQPLAGFPLAVAIGVPVSEYWIVVSAAIYLAVVAAWLAGLVVELRIRDLAQNAALKREVLPALYGRLFRIWTMVAVLGFSGMIAITALMIWQPEWS